MIERKRPQYETIRRPGMYDHQEIIDDIDQAWEAIEELQRLHCDKPDKPKGFFAPFQKWWRENMTRQSTNVDMAREAFCAGYDEGKKRGRRRGDEY